MCEEDVKAKVAKNIKEILNELPDRLDDALKGIGLCAIALKIAAIGDDVGDQAVAKFIARKMLADIDELKKRVITILEEKTQTEEKAP